MFRHTPFTLSSLLLACSLYTRCAAQSNVFHPTVLNPNGTDVWTVGEVATVRWSNNGLDIPPNKHGQVLLGFTGLPGPFGTNVWYDQPLADGFLISDEVVNVVVPDVPSGNFYFIQLSGDVATSDQDTPFTIINPKSPAQPLSEVVEPSTIAISSAPSATASHFSASSAATSSASTTSTQSSSTSSTSSASAPSSTSSSGAAQEGGGYGWSYLLLVCGGSAMALAV
ncbi:hypothetical protein PYCCODRAFT_1430802 [Trametes coccinea BRFM310]|uniref:Ser-Thr-rich glycosyl-phosphatidyl-inositol-anchored membrane family-domain-containing protein n=1 Tax=Trametes coccinea (strain BRFM310) TaxID=1353009 RepID=A0A1Y2J2J6_TRAC3|nr:hypothetical protein PYCCODRAFT_1430802 [Trametes coccinea BRFM310]